MMRFAMLLLLALLAWVYWPATGADFVIDDYVFVATARMVENPLPAFWQSHFYEPYYFRPLGILSWWAATQAFSLDYQGHSVVNLVIHGASVCLLAVLLRDVGVKKWATLAAATLLALSPFSLTATLWPSNRFDLLAVLFLLCTAISLVRVLRGGGVRWWAALGLSALAACWSKELAFPAATMMAFVALFYSGATVRVRASAFAVLGVTISAAFFWRHALIAQPYAVTGADPLTRFLEGGRAWINAAPEFAALALNESNVSIAAWLIVGVVLLAALLPARRSQRRLAGESVTGPSVGMVLGAMAVWVAISIVQMPLAGAFSRMLDGGALGTITFGRFYYASMAALAVVAGMVLTGARMSAVLSVVVVLSAVVLGAQQRTTADAFARWTQTEIRPVALAATAVVDKNTPVQGGSRCVFVFLGTQSNHPWFRMFSDVTVKARTANLSATGSCHILTESTPWIFAFPAGVAPADLGLPTVPDVGGAKADSTWGTIRYRYRLAPKDVQSLPTARFFDWRDGQFVEVTKEVQSGTRLVKTHGWGF
ncbi:MAG: hypothetical protein EAZ21_01065 [Betaproteobacteria bacterium]|nr:MAG: hypothetical protein EAZ21_01065 [Betaproteobacteria bacterium]